MSTRQRAIKRSHVVNDEHDVLLELEDARAALADALEKAKAVIAVDAVREFNEELETTREARLRESYHSNVPLERIHLTLPLSIALEK